MLKILIVALFFTNTLLGASLVSGIGYLSLTMKGYDNLPKSATTFGLGFVNDFPYETNKSLQLSFYYQSTQSHGQMVLDELVFKIGQMHAVSPRVGFGLGIQLNHVLDSDFSEPLFPSSGLGLCAVSYYQLFPHLRVNVEYSHLTYSLSNAYAESLLSNEIRFGFSSNL